MKGCRIFAFIRLFIVIPAAYVILVYVEYETYGFQRFATRCGRELRLGLAQRADARAVGEQGPQAHGGARLALLA
jgi:hypothetical protein